MPEYVPEGAEKVEVTEQVKVVEEDPTDAYIVPGPELSAAIAEKVGEKKLKKVIKEGGKRGVEIEGAADMGGLKFFCNTVDEPEGQIELLVESVKAMNMKSDPTEEERKGGSGKIGKMILNCTDDVLNVVAYVPKNYPELDCKSWLAHVCELAVGGGSMMEKLVTISEVGDDCSSANWMQAVIKKDGNLGVFPLKMRDPCITNALAFLKKLDLFPDGDDEDDDDMCFGEDDFPQVGDEEEEAASPENYDLLEPASEALSDAKMEKKMKKVIKEGGKKGVEIEGVSDMGGLQFFCTEMKEPEGNCAMLVESMRAMNHKSDPTEEERKGGSGNVGKTIVSISDDLCSIVAYVPESKTESCEATAWLVNTVSELLKNGEDKSNTEERAKEMVKSYSGNEKTFAKCEITKGNGLFPLKMRDETINYALNYLKARGLFPDGNDDDDDEEMCFGDGDFPEM